MCLSLHLLHSWCVLLAATQEEADLIGVAEKVGSQDLAELFTPSQALVISNEQGGGEDTTIVDWSSLTMKRKSITQASPASS